MATFSISNNNPFNLRSNHVNWLGKVGSFKGFCVFKDLEFGVRAGLINLATQIRRCDSLRDLVYRYAPPFENDSKAYYSYLSERLGIDWPSKDDKTFFLELAYFIVIYEGSFVSLSFLRRVDKHYHIFVKHLALLQKHG